jgi:large subunit ribosomal protein L16
MLQPKKTKFRKAFKGRVKGKATRGCHLSFGHHGLQALSSGRITARQIEAGRRAITRAIKRMGRVWIRVFPDVPVSSKPAEVRMGSGKGSVDYWACRVRPGCIIYEIESTDGSKDLAEEAMRLASAKMPFKTQFVSRESRGGLS